MNVTSLITSKYWNMFGAETISGWVELCVATYLIYTDKTAFNPDEKVTTAHNLLNISVSFDVDFNLVANVDREILVQQRVNVDYSKYIKSYECEESNPYIDLNGASPKTYIEGEKLLICVTDDSNNIVKVESINNLTVSHVGTTDYHYIKNSVFDAALTTHTCQDGTGGIGAGRVCSVEISLLSRFFQL